MSRSHTTSSRFGIHAYEDVADRGLRLLEFDRSVLVNDLDSPAFRRQSVPAISLPQDLHVCATTD